MEHKAWIMPLFYFYLTLLFIKGKFVCSGVGEKYF